MSNKSKSILLMIGSVLAFTLMTISIKYSGDLPIPVKLLFRNLVSLLVTFWALKQSNTRLLGLPQNRKYLFYRSLLGITGMGLFFYSIENLHLTDASILSKLSPFFVTLFAFLFLKEKIKKYQIISLIIVFSSAMLVIKPRFDLSILPALGGFIGAAAAGGAYTLVRFLNGTEKPATIIFFFSLISLIIISPLSIYYFEIPSANQLIFLILIGVFATLGQFGMTFAYRYSAASEVSFYSYIHIIFAALADYLIWGEVADSLSLLGGLLIIVTSLIIFLKNKSS
ncbi:DMT family transporter [Candidatus Kapabacteria bacterium]|nr:DMT family transporter [Candidatus Kapabacteria bacterium]